MSTKGCLNNPDIFCYFCGQFVIMKQRPNITDFVKKHIMSILERLWMIKTNYGLRTRSAAFVLTN